MTIEGKDKVNQCRFCGRVNCVNRGNIEIAKENYSCYEKSSCAGCAAYNFCSNPYKDRFKEGSKANFDISECLIGPNSCDECYMACHCKNRGLEDAKFEMGLSESSNPICFSGYHSTK